MTGFAPLSHDDHIHAQKFVGEPRIIGPKWAHLPTLTIGFLGIQIFWSVEMGYASPYLLSLGLSKSAMSLVFLAGPLSGLIVQPLVGLLADNNTSRFGRRRPWMMLGTAISCVAMLLLGYTRAVASVFTGWNTPSNDLLTVILAVLSIYLIDFSINVIMAVDRALLVDTLPPAEQTSANAWAALMVGFGSVIGFFVGSISLTNLFPFLGNTQLEVLSAVVALLLLFVHLLVAFCVKERILLPTKDRGDQECNVKRPNAVIQEARALWSNFCTLPSVIRRILFIQFFSSLAWFPLLFYTSVYIGDLYRRATPLSSDPSVDELQNRDAEATRLATRALFFSSLVALFFNLVLPICTQTTVTVNPSQDKAARLKWWRMLIPEHLKLKLVDVWAASHLVFAVAMFGTWLTSSVGGATFLITITGFSWAVGQWAPFSLLGETILTSPDCDSQRAPILLSDAHILARGESDQDVEAEAFLAQAQDEADEYEHCEDDEDDPGMEKRHSTSSNTILSNQNARTSRLHIALDAGDMGWNENGAEGTTTGRGDDMNGLSSKAGMILGIHNIAMVIPQFLVTGLSALVFALFDPVRPHRGVLTSPPNHRHTTMGRRTVDMQDESGQSNSVVYMFRLAGLGALAAFILTLRLSRALRHR